MKYSVVLKRAVEVTRVLKLVLTTFFVLGNIMKAILVPEHQCCSFKAAMLFFKKWKFVFNWDVVLLFTREEFVFEKNGFVVVKKFIYQN